MNVSEVLSEWKLNPGASLSAVQEVASGLCLSLPHDYRDFLGKYNGGEGFIKDNYLILWRAEEIVLFNQEYEVHEYAPGIILFGSDGGGEGYGFDTREPSFPIVKIPFVGMDLSEAIPVARTFTDLFEALAESES